MAAMLVISRVSSDMQNDPDNQGCRVNRSEMVRVKTREPATYGSHGV